MSKNAYAQSGVDVEAGYEVVERIKKHVARTERAGLPECNQAGAAQSGRSTIAGTSDEDEAGC